MEEEGRPAITVVSIGGGNEHIAICWAAEKLGAKNIKIVRDTQLALISRDKKPGNQEKLKSEVRASVEAFRVRAVVIASHRKEGSISTRAQRSGVRRAMHTVREWNLPIKRIIGILFDEKGDEKEVSTMYIP